MITFRNDTLWASNAVPTLTIPAILNQQRKRGPVPSQQEQWAPPQTRQEERYQLTIECKKDVSIEEMFKEDNESAKPLLVQMVNSKIKEILMSRGFY